MRITWRNEWRVWDENWQLGQEAASVPEEEEWASVPEEEEWAWYTDIREEEEPATSWSVALEDHSDVGRLPPLPLLEIS